MTSIRWRQYDGKFSHILLFIHVPNNLRTWRCDEAKCCKYLYVKKIATGGQGMLHVRRIPPSEEFKNSTEVCFCSVIDHTTPWCPLSLSPCSPPSVLLQRHRRLSPTSSCPRYGLRMAFRGCQGRHPRNRSQPVEEGAPAVE